MFQNNSFQLPVTSGQRPASNLDQSQKSCRVQEIRDCPHQHFHVIYASKPARLVVHICSTRSVKEYL